MPKIDLSGLAPLRSLLSRAPQARAHRLGFANEDDGCVRLDIMGDIDPYFGISAANVMAQLDGVTATEIKIRINSGGGDVLEGVAIHNLLAAHPARKTAEIFGVAASAASWIAMVAEEIVIWEGAMMMIHQSWQGLAGNADILEEAAAVLRKIDDSMRTAYARRTGIADDEIRAMMAAETWMTAEEAVAKKFADRLLKIGSTATEPAAAQAAERPAAQVKSVTPEILAGLHALAASMTAGR
jgi:ATP-dependent protease ClpP protease subunit